MTDFDSLMRRLKDEPVPVILAQTEQMVLERVSGYSFEREAFSVRAVAITAAVLMGIGGGLLPDYEPAARRAVVPFGESAELAPSTLLAGDR